MAATLELDVHEGRAPSGWDEGLRAVGGVVFHCEAWADYKVREGGGEPLFFVWKEGAEVAGRALAIRRPGRASRLGRLASKVSFDSPPATPGRSGDDYVAPLRPWSRRSPGLVEVSLGSFDALGPWSPATPPHSRSRSEFPLPPGDAGAVWEGMRKLARRKVQRARKADLGIGVAGTERDFADFVEVFAVTQERLRRNKDYVPGHGFEDEVFRDAVAGLSASGAGRLYLARDGARLEAAVLFATFGERAYLIHSVATDAGRDAGAPFLVVFEALRDLRESGLATINLGGAGGAAEDPASPDHGLFQFKTRFGAAPEPRTSGSLVPRPGRRRLVAATRRLVGR
ncbi:MAG: GNAT family N-acetyltransferase [Solirubrobacterales bacterium]